MLVLSRRVGESLVIGDDIVITILEQRGDIVRVGVDAPRHIQVRRQELLTQVAETNRAAASPRAAAADVVARLAAHKAAPPTQAAPSDTPPTAAPAEEGRAADDADDPKPPAS